MLMMNKNSGLLTVHMPNRIIEVSSIKGVVKKKKRKVGDLMVLLQWSISEPAQFSPRKKK